MVPVAAPTPATTSASCSRHHLAARLPRQVRPPGRVEASSDVGRSNLWHGDLWDGTFFPVHNWYIYRISPTNIRDVEINYENPLKSAEIYI